jgi:predicted regulator of Ras-like GTPase activity (Roadblock/LC7/MglB family)/DNA-binding response OmpR family regulator
MKTVLIVDDEKSFLLSLEAGLRQYAGSFAIVTAPNGKEAVEVLKRSKVDLVVTDLNMPEMDGFELLASMAKSHPDVPAMIMTAYSTPAIKSRLEALGSLRVQEKPIHFKELGDAIVASLSSMDQSYLKGITLPAFLQILEVERKTCTLKITSKGLTGFLCLREGELFEAATGSQRGESAAYAILSWEDVAIEINSICKVTANNIGKSLNHIVMEGFRLKDERKRAAGGAAVPANGARAGAPATAVAAKPSPEPAPPAEPAKPEGKKEDKMTAIRAILTEFTKLQGVSAVCLVGRDGFLLDSIATRGIDTEMIGAIASSGYGASESMGNQLGKGSMRMSMSEFERGPVMFSPVGEDSLIVIIAEQEANLGMIRMKLKKEVQALASATSA